MTTRKKIWILLYFFFSLTLFLSLFSCKTCDPCIVSTEKKDSIVYKIDTVLVAVPGFDGPTVYLENPCKDLCDSLGRLKHVNVVKKKGGQTIKISTQGNGLNISSNTKDTTIKTSVGSKETYSKEKNAVVIREQCKRDHRNSFDGFCRWFFYIVGPALGLYIGLRLKKVIP